MLLAQVYDIIGHMGNIATIPLSFKPLLWSADFSQLDLQKNRKYIIHQLLNYGDLDAFAWLKRTYSLPALQATFIHSPQKMYTDRSFFFVTKFLLNINQQSLSKIQYVSMAS
jgi:hypothetical protein